ncbi:hypothetical protein IF1G_10123 [Cordyceps javanica]|uniref:Uncharacterized protein n=1 Tax=Cordyceps javanica TaxID=43265 RepID=A0A545VMN0_9HYPO|nr:hypothetical protein IF1G_10123 [Cordyceps javanica]TQW02967.1 hypothetical protein IF2G_09484 [Cordyceps javanica]
MSSLLAQPSFLKALYVGNALWFTSAFYHFSFRQDLMMRKLSLRRSSRDAAVAALPSGDAWHHDIMAYLGGMNTALAALAVFRVYGLWRRVAGSAAAAPLSVRTADGDFSPDFMVLVVLGLGNCSQAVLNFTRSRASGRWIMGKGLDRITVLDAVFTVLDWAAALSGR